MGTKLRHYTRIHSHFPQKHSLINPIHHFQLKYIMLYVSTCIKKIIHNNKLNQTQP